MQVQVRVVENRVFVIFSNKTMLIARTNYGLVWGVNGKTHSTTEQEVKTWLQEAGVDPSVLDHIQPRIYERPVSASRAVGTLAGVPVFRKDDVRLMSAVSRSGLSRTIALVLGRNTLESEVRDKLIRYKLFVDSLNESAKVRVIRPKAAKALAGVPVFEDLSSLPDVGRQALIRQIDKALEKDLDGEVKAQLTNYKQALLV